MGQKGRRYMFYVDRRHLKKFEDDWATILLGISLFVSPILEKSQTSFFTISPPRTEKKTRDSLFSTFHSIRIAAATASRGSIPLLRLPCNVSPPAHRLSHSRDSRVRVCIYIYTHTAARGQIYTI